MAGKFCTWYDRDNGGWELFGCGYATREIAEVACRENQARWQRSFDAGCPWLGKVDCYGRIRTRASVVPVFYLTTKGSRLGKSGKRLRLPLD